MRRNSCDAMRRWPLQSILMAMLACSTMCAGAGAQILVDCTGVNTSAYKTITAALQSAPLVGATIVVTGPCTENVTIGGFYDMNLGAATGKTATLTGSLTVSDSNKVYLYGLNVTNGSGTGITVNSSNGVTLDTCTSNGNTSTGNPADGLAVSSLSEVTILGTSAFDNNQRYGMNLDDHADVGLVNYSGSTDVSGNGVSGIWITQDSELTGLGPATIENNGSTAIADNNGTAAGFGVEIYGLSGAQFGDCFGTNLIKGNVFGGVSVQENSQFSTFKCVNGYSNDLESNGPVGIFVALGGEATLDAATTVSGHAGPAVEVTSGGSFYTYGPVVFTNNGSLSNSRGAEIALSGNSHALFNGGTVTSSIGPAILAQLGSTVNFSQVTFGGNGGGIIQCDNTSFMWTDITSPSERKLMACTVPSLPPGGLLVSPGSHGMPDLTVIRNRQAQYRRAVASALSMHEGSTRP